MITSEGIFVEVIPTDLEKMALNFSFIQELQTLLKS